MAFRHEAFRIDAALVKQMPDGSVRVPGHLTKPGVFTYTTADGKQVRELRPADEVARAEYADAHVTIGHPPKGVGPDSYARLNVGHVSAGSVKATEDGVDATVVLRRKDAIDGALNGGYHDLSCGYAVQIEDKAGVDPAFGAYDRIQRNLVINHVALLPRGDGRLGTDCSLRLDGAGEQIVEGSVDEQARALTADIARQRADAHLPWDECIAKAEKEYGDKDEAQRVCGAIKAKYGDSMKTKIRQDGKEVEVLAGSPEHVAFLEQEATVARARADASDRALAERDAAGAIGRREALVTQAIGCGVATTRKDGANEVALNEREIKVAVVQKRVDSAFTGKNADGSPCSDAYLDGMFASAVKAPAAAPAPALAAALNGGARSDAATDVFANLETLAASTDDAWRVK